MDKISNDIYNLLSEIPDPEIPAINIVELGIVRGVDVSGEEITVTITPTYTGCPAMYAIEADIISKLREKEIENVKINTVLSPAWTTAWLTGEAREKLRIYGIAPPVDGINTPCCPRCYSARVEIKSAFGSTPCKSLYYCNDCREPFEHFKCH